MKNYYREFNKFVKGQIELNKDVKDLNPNWDGWGYLYLIHERDRILQD